MVRIFVKCVQANKMDMCKNDNVIMDQSLNWEAKLRNH